MPTGYSRIGDLYGTNICFILGDRTTFSGESCGGFVVECEFPVLGKGSVNSGEGTKNGVDIKWALEML